MQPFFGLFQAGVFFLSVRVPYRGPRTPAEDGQAYYHDYYAVSFTFFYFIFCRMLPKVLYVFPIIRSM